jgi:hypothetical protein
MQFRIRQYALSPHPIWKSFAKCLFTLFLLSSCGGPDPRFVAESYDEYTETLTDAVIGSPQGVTVIPKAAPVGENATIGPIATGAGGSVIIGTGSGGSFGEGGSFTGSGGFAGTSTGGFAGTGGSDDGGIGNDSSGFGFWHFDDCSPNSHFLTDSSGFGANAQQPLTAACVPGLSGQGVQIRTQKDVIQVPDEPQFTVDDRVAVAAWVFPNTVTGNQPIIIKRLNNQTSFSLGIHNGNIEMSVVLTTGTTVISRAPIAAGTWTHVAGMYDGTFVFLFINGQQFGQVFGGAALRNVFAPIRIGATTQAQHLDGIVDEVFVSTQNISKDVLTALSCIHRSSTLAVSPATSGPVPFDTTVHYDVSVTDNDVGFCPNGTNYDMFFEFFDPTIRTEFDPPGSFQFAVPGQTVTFGVEVTGTEDAFSGVHQLPFFVDGFSFSQGGQENFEQLFGQLTYELTEPSGCFVSTRRELMITGVNVVDDPVRTFGVFSPGFGVPVDGGVRGSGGAFPGSGGGAGDVAGGFLGSGGSGFPGSGGVRGVPDAEPPPSNPDSLGVWTFGHLMRDMAPTPEQGPAFTERVFQTWLTDQPLNGFIVPARPAMQQTLLDVWPRTSNGELDLDHPPLRLQAIVNRVDLRDLAHGSAGEGRFVFGVNGFGGFPLQFTVILEYNLPAQTEQDVQDWANLWHSLSSHPFPSEEYNAALEAITRRFAGRNASPGSVNGSAIASFRTNEFVLGPVWELREFELASSGFLQEIPVHETPDLSFNGSRVFADFVNQNADAIKAELAGFSGNTVPAQFEGLNFRAGSAFNGTFFPDIVSWFAPGIVDSDARFHASINTCNGCHGPDTGTQFLQVTPRFAGNEAVLSPFLTGTTVFDQFSGQVRTLNDLGRRRADLTSLVCPPSDGDAGTTPPADVAAPQDVTPIPFPIEAGVPTPIP